MDQDEASKQTVQSIHRRRSVGRSSCWLAGWVGISRPRGDRPTVRLITDTLGHRPGKPQRETGPILGAAWLQRVTRPAVGSVCVRNVLSSSSLSSRMRLSVVSILRNPRNERNGHNAAVDVFVGLLCSLRWMETMHAYVMSCRCRERA